MVRLSESPLRLNGNQLKIIALLTMTCDHVGMALFPELLILRVIGRLSMPLYAFMIAQGCRYTRNRWRYFGGIAGLGLLCQVVYYFAMDSLYQCILITFSLSIGLICLLDWSRKKHPALCAVCMSAALVAVFGITDGLPLLLRGTDFWVDYGFLGVLLPVFMYLGRNHWEQLAFGAVGTVLLCAWQGSIQWFSVLALPLLALYDGTRGKARLKYLFYIYYPVHLVVIQLLSMLFFT